MKIFTIIAQKTYNFTRNNIIKKISDNVLPYKEKRLILPTVLI